MTDRREPASHRSADQEASPADSGGGIPYLFGDLLALARADWVRQMAARLEAHGHTGYRASDAVVVRLLRRRGSATIGELGTRLGVTHQAARKLVNALAARGLVAETRDARDARRVNVSLSPAGRAYAEAVLATVYGLNRELAARLSASELAAADTALRAAIAEPGMRAVADHIPPPGGRT